MDPRLVAAAFGMNPDGVMIYLLTASMQAACPTSTNGDDEVRHLTPPFAIGALRRGKQIEQFLGGFDHGEEHVIRWAALSPAKDHITLYLSEVIDVGTDTFWDMSEFPPLDPDEETWGKIVGTAAGPDDALALAERELGADPGRWVNQGVVGSEYGGYRATRNPGSSSNP